MKDKLKKLLLEMVPVILGVLIALLINNWKESAADQRYVEKSLAAIEKDIRESKVSTEEVLEKHYAVIDSISHYLENTDLSIQEIVGNAGGIQYPFTKNIALRFFVSSKADLLDYETISILTNIEESSKMMSKKFDKLMDFAYEKIDSQDQKDKYSFAIHLANVIDSEEQLVELYQEYLGEKEAESLVEDQ